MIGKAEARERVKKLRTLIERNRALYHERDTQEMSDEAFDALKHELKAIEDAYPDLRTPNSPTQRVAGTALKHFTKVRHSVRQWSLEDAFTEEELRQFDERTRKLLAEHFGKAVRPRYTCELKIDGLHIVFTYTNGVFTQGATRGDGEVGEDVTQNLRTIGDVPEKLTEPVSLVVEGEVFMRRSVWEALNKERKVKGEALLANPRNAAAGAIRQLDPAVAAKRSLSCFVYDIVSPAGAIPPTQYEELQRLRALGFSVSKQFRRVESVAEVLEYWQHWAKERKNVDFWLDGVVVKLDERLYQEALGYTGKAPRWALALKFPGEETATRIKDITVGLGRTGKLTPVAVLEPVQLLGTTITHATLHNANEIARLDARIGDTVIIKKAGDIIPQVVRVLPDLRPKDTAAFSMPSRCPFCGGPVTRPAGEVNVYCKNPHCGARRRRRLIFFAGKQGLDIVGLGEKVVARLIEEGLVKEWADFFRLTPDDLADLSGFGEISAQKLVTNIKKRKRVELAQFIRALGIPHVGKETAQDIADFITARAGSLPKNIAALLRVARTLTLEDYSTIPGVGPVVAKSIHTFFNASSERRSLERLHNVGLTFTGVSSLSNKLNGRVFVFTGTLKALTREEAGGKVRALGGTVAPRIRQDVTDLVAGKNPGSKLKEAKAAGIRVLSESDFWALI